MGRSVQSGSTPRTRIALLEARVVATAEAQEGMIARRQLAEIGMSKAGIVRWVERGRLHRRHPGVYSLGHRRTTERGRLIAALLYAGPGAALRRRSWRRLVGGRRSIRRARSRSPRPTGAARCPGSGCASARTSNEWSTEASRSPHLPRPCATLRPSCPGTRCGRRSRKRTSAAASTRRHSKPPAAPAAPRSARRFTTTSPHLPSDWPRRRARRRRRARPSRCRRQRPQSGAVPARTRVPRRPLQLAAGLPRTRARRGGSERGAQAATAGRPMPITFSRRLRAVKANSFISCEVASM